MVFVKEISVVLYFSVVLKILLHCSVEFLMLSQSIKAFFLGRYLLFQFNGYANTKLYKVILLNLKHMKTVSLEVVSTSGVFKIHKANLNIITSLAFSSILL